MTSPAKPAPVRYIRDRVTDARWVSAEEVESDVAYPEMRRLRESGRRVSRSTGDGPMRIYVDWSHQATPNPGKRASGPSGRRVAPRAPEIATQRRSGGTQPESERRRKVLPIRLDAAATSALEDLKTRWRLSRSEVVARLLVEATGALAIVSAPNSPE